MIPDPEIEARYGPDEFDWDFDIIALNPDAGARSMGFAIGLGLAKTLTRAIADCRWYHAKKGYDGLTIVHGPTGMSWPYEYLEELRKERWNET